MVDVDLIILREYFKENSDFRKSAITIDKMSVGLRNDLYKVILGNANLETTLRQLSDRVTQLDTIIARSKGNEGRIVSEIKRIGLDIKSLSVNLKEFLLDLNRRINRCAVQYKNICSEYGLEVEINGKDTSFLRWDHLRPDPVAVLDSLSYIDKFSSELKKDREKNVTKLRQNSRLLANGANQPAIEDDDDFQRIKTNINLVLINTNVEGLQKITNAIADFFEATKKCSSLFSDPYFKISGDSHLESKFDKLPILLGGLGIPYKEDGRLVKLLLTDIKKLTKIANENACRLVTNINSIPQGIQVMDWAVTLMRQLMVLLPSICAVLIEISKLDAIVESNTADEYSRLAINFPSSLDHILDNNTTAVNITKITRALERTLRI